MNSLIKFLDGIGKLVWQFFLLFSTLCFTACEESRSINVTLSDLFYPKHVKVSIVEKEAEGIFSVHFQYEKKYPSLEIYEFYNNGLKKRGWEKIQWFQPQRSNDMWQHFFEEKENGTVDEVFQYLSAWCDKNKTKLAVLSLRYVDQKDVQDVYFQVFPFIALEDIKPGSSVISSGKTD